MWADPKDALQMKSRQNKPYCDFGLFLSPSTSMYACLFAGVWACMPLLPLYACSFHFISFFCFSYFLPPKARKWLRCFLNKTMCFFVADNFRSVCVCKILHFILFNDWHTLNYTIASCPMPLCYVLVSFVLLFDFFLSKPKSINSLENYFQMISFTVALDFFRLAGAFNSHFLRPVPVSVLSFKDGKGILTLRSPHLRKHFVNGDLSQLFEHIFVFLPIIYNHFGIS